MTERRRVRYAQHAVPSQDVAIPDGPYTAPPAAGVVQGKPPILGAPPYVVTTYDARQLGGSDFFFAGIPQNGGGGALLPVVYTVPEGYTATLRQIRVTMTPNFFVGGAGNDPPIDGAGNLVMTTPFISVIVSGSSAPGQSEIEPYGFGVGGFVADVYATANPGETIGAFVRVFVGESGLYGAAYTVELYGHLIPASGQDAAQNPGSKRAIPVTPKADADYAAGGS